MDLLVEQATLVGDDSLISLKGTRSDGHTIFLFLRTTDPEDVRRFPKGSRCVLTVDRKLDAPSMA